SFMVGPVTGEGILDILVEAMGRVNYGADIHDRKGVVGMVEIADSSSAHQLKNWDIVPFPFDDTMLGTLKYGTTKGYGPVFRRGSFMMNKKGDTFLDMRGWKKGNVWVNGHNLGRFWSIGPQQTLFLPGAWMKEG